MLSTEDDSLGDGFISVSDGLLGDFGLLLHILQLLPHVSVLVLQLDVLMEKNINSLYHSLKATITDVRLKTLDSFLSVEAERMFLVKESNFQHPSFMKSSEL